MDTTSYFPVGTLVLANDDAFPYEIRAVDIRVTPKGVVTLYCLLDPGCDINTSYEHCRTLYAENVTLYTPTLQPYV